MQRASQGEGWQEVFVVMGAKLGGVGVLNLGRVFQGQWEVEGSGGLFWSYGSRNLVGCMSEWGGVHRP